MLAAENQPPRDVCTVRAILTDPALCISRPQLRLLAWAALKAENNQTIRQSVLQRGAA